MSGPPAEGETWPHELFWDYSVALYSRPGVEAACIELQRRHHARSSEPAVLRVGEIRSELYGAGAVAVAVLSR